MSSRQKWLFRSMALILALGLGECALSLSCMILPRVQYFLSPPSKRATVSDAVLGKRMSPYYPGNDSWGYRNPAVPDHCDVLAIGDSATYGFAAVPSKSWPRQLEPMSNLRVYNMSTGGYGPCEYYALLDKGLILHPKIVVLGLSISNDLFDAFATVYLEKRFPEYRSHDAAVLQQIENTERVVKLVNLEKGKGEDSAQNTTSVKAWLSDHSSLYGLARALANLSTGRTHVSLLREGSPPQAAPEVAAQRPFRVAYNADPHRATVFINSELRGFAVNLDEPQIQEGWRITRTILQAMQSKLKAQGIRLIIVIMPTKARIYRELVKAEMKDMPGSFFETLEREERLTTAIESFLKSHGIAFVNATPSLLSYLQKGDAPPYPHSDDYHPNATGYQAIAEAVLPADPGW